MLTTMTLTIDYRNIALIIKVVTVIRRPWGNCVYMVYSILSCNAVLQILICPIVKREPRNELAQLTQGWQNLFPFPRTGYLKIFWGPNQTAQPSQGLFTPCKGPFFFQNELVTQIILHIDLNQ